MKQLQYNAATGKRTWVEVPDVEVVPPVTDPRIVAMREAYRQATRALCTLAGMTPVDKLEDADYVATVGAAYAASPAQAAMLADTLLYTLQTLRLDDGRDAWDRI